MSTTCPRLTNAKPIALLALLALACCHGRPVTPAQPAPANEKVWKHFEEGHIGTDGIARNAKLGALIETPEGQLWIDGLDSWPDALLGKKVHVTGFLEKRKDLPVFVPKPGEPQKTGMPVEEGTDLDAAGTRYVIIRATWTQAD